MQILAFPKGDKVIITKCNMDFSAHLKDTHRKKAPSNKTPAFTKSTNMGIWVESTLYKSS